MPEGDSIHKMARAMRPLLEGKRVVEVWLRDRGEVDMLAGREVDSIEAIGKHLLVAFGARVALRVHLGMKGTWHRYRRGEKWKLPESTAVVRISTDRIDVVCFRATTAELVDRRRLRAHPALGRLGPDLLDETIDLDVVLHRARGVVHRHRATGELLLDQKIAAGIGNVYKSELCFLAGVHPTTPVRDIDDGTLRDLYETARELLFRNLDTARRITVPPTLHRSTGEHLYVYDRKGRPCLRCGTVIGRFALGDDARATFVCPRCQPVLTRTQSPWPRG